MKKVVKRHHPKIFVLRSPLFLSKLCYVSYLLKQYNTIFLTTLSYLFTDGNKIETISKALINMITFKSIGKGVITYWNCETIPHTLCT